jgi:hypothetical protein
MRDVFCMSSDACSCASCACHVHAVYVQARPCLRVTIQKTEVRGPKTSPFVVYMLHVRTAFTVRGLARRYSDFVMLDSNLRAHFVNRSVPHPALPLPSCCAFAAAGATCHAGRRSGRAHGVGGFWTGGAYLCCRASATWGSSPPTSSSSAAGSCKSTWTSSLPMSPLPIRPRFSTFSRSLFLFFPTLPPLPPSAHARQRIVGLFPLCSNLF